LTKSPGESRQHGAATADKLRPDLGISEREVDFGVELLNDLGRRVLGSPDAERRA